MTRFISPLGCFTPVVRAFDLSGLKRLETIEQACAVKTIVLFRTPGATDGAHTTVFGSFLA